jgi:hypothetical protein
LTLTAAPVYNQVYLAARLEVQSTAVNLAGTRLYRAACCQIGSAWTTTLETSPQLVIELGSLVADDFRMIARVLPPSNTASREATGGES